MPTPSANLTQTAVSGKFGRVFLWSLGAVSPGPVNFKKWTIDPQADDIDTTGFEDGGWKDGLGGLVGADITLEGPYQISRTGGVPAPVNLLLVPTSYFVYEFYNVHPDYGNAGNLLKYMGVAQLISLPVEQEVSQAAMNTFHAKSRGRIYWPGSDFPTVATLAALFANRAG